MMANKSLALTPKGLTGPVGEARVDCGLGGGGAAQLYDVPTRAIVAPLRPASVPARLRLSRRAVSPANGRCRIRHG